MSCPLHEGAGSLFSKLVVEQIPDLLVDIPFQSQLVGGVFVNLGDFASQITVLDSSFLY